MVISPLFLIATTSGSCHNRIGKTERILLTFHGGQAQLLSDLGILDLGGLVEGHAADEPGEVAGASDGAAAAESLELDVGDCV